MQTIKQPEFKPFEFQQRMAEDKKLDTMFALMDGLSAYGHMGLIAPGVNRYVDEWREYRRES